MKFRICENEGCWMTYSTGKNYGDTFGYMIYPNTEKKGLCPMCNPNSDWYMDPKICYSLVLPCGCGKINKHSGMACTEPEEIQMEAYRKKRNIKNEKTSLA